MDIYSVVVPVYNSEKTLEQLYSRVCSVFFNMKDCDFELILVDDSSKDQSFLVMTKLHQQDSRVKIIQLSKNYGQHNAILCGFHFATGDFVITMDDDLQHPPEEIPKLISYLKTHENIDVVIGKYDAKKHSHFRNFGSKMATMLTLKTSKGLSDLKMTSFRLMKKNIVQMMLEIHISTPRIGYLLLEVTNRIANVEIHHDERQYGHSQYTLKRLIHVFFNNIFTNTIFPLILLRNVGIISFLISIILASYYICRYFFVGIGIQGWTTIILLQLLFSGIILFGLGIVGEYLLRILNESKKMKNFNIRNKKL